MCTPAQALCFRHGQQPRQQPFERRGVSVARSSSGETLPVRDAVAQRRDLRPLRPLGPSAPERRAYRRIAGTPCDRRPVDPRGRHQGASGLQVLRRAGPYAHRLELRGRLRVAEREDSRLSFRIVRHCGHGRRRCPSSELIVTARGNRRVAVLRAHLEGDAAHEISGGKTPEAERFCDKIGSARFSASQSSGNRDDFFLHPVRDRKRLIYFLDTACPFPILRIILSTSLYFLINTLRSISE